MLVLLGTGVRGLYGVLSQDWSASPDQLAWGLLIEEAAQSASLRYDQLIYYPHEGGTILLSLAALMLPSPVLGLPALSWVALLADTGIRGLQVGIVHRLFGPRIALYFALWTVMAVPFMLPWATVNFGLHALSSFWPFVFLYVFTKPAFRLSRPLRCGITTGLALWWSYHSVIFIPAYWLFVARHEAENRRRWDDLLKFTAIVGLVVIPHVIIRTVFDPGFSLVSDDLMAIRGLSFSAPALGWAVLINPVKVWLYALPGASGLPAVGWLPSIGSRMIWGAAGLIGLGAALYHGRRRDGALMLGALIKAVFLFIYALSPFFYGSAGQSAFVYYRHLYYILPFFALTVLYGFFVLSRAPFRTIGICWIVYAMLGTGLYLTEAKPPEMSACRGAGWALAQKLGHDPIRLNALLNLAAPDDRQEWTVGYGWGLTAALLKDIDRPDHPAIKRLAGYLNQFPESRKTDILRGMHHAFSAEVTPQLNISLLPVLEQSVQRERPPGI